MTKDSPWGQTKIPKELEKEHKAQIKEKRKKEKLREEHKAWWKDFYGRYMQQASQDPYKDLASKGYAVVNDKEELIKVLESVIGKGRNIDITYEEPDDEKDLS